MRRLVFLILIIAFLTACSSKMHSYSNKAGRREYTITNTGEHKDPIVTGDIYDYYGKIPLRTTGGIKIKEKIMARTNANGGFSFTLKPGNYQLTALGIPYDIFETKAIELKSGDTLSIHFYLDVYSKPMP